MNVYSTSVTRPFQKDVAKISAYFEEKRALGTEQFIEIAPGIFKIAPGVEGLPQWEMPIFVPKEKAVLIDTRMYERVNGSISKGYEVKNAMDRAYIELEWNLHSDNFQTIAAPICAIYSEWLVQLLTRRFTMSPAQKSIAQAALAFYAWSYFIAKYEWDQYTPAQITGNFIRFASTKLRMTPNFISDLVESSTFVEEVLRPAFQRDVRGVSLDDICRFATAYIGSPAIVIDSQVLITYAVSPSNWFGDFAGRITAIAVEHVPMMAYMIYQANDKGVYRQTVVGQAIETCRRAGVKSDDIVRWVSALKD